MKKKYTHNEIVHNMKAPTIIVPMILNILRENDINISSVVDFWCGIWTWLASFKDNGVPEILWLDGERYKKTLLEKHIKNTQFKIVDLEKPIILEQSYDLVVSLEVAEHISEDNVDTFIKSLTDAGKIILFSVAIPNQGGDHHINEQWPSYWIWKFLKHDYVFYDCIRDKIWDNPEIEVRYKQNIFLVTHKDITLNITQWYIYDIVHPEYWKRYEGVKSIFKMLLREIKKKFQ